MSRIVGKIRHNKPLLYGYHGKKNFGDDLFVGALKLYGGQILGTDRVVFLSLGDSRGSADRWAKIDRSAS